MNNMVYTKLLSCIKAPTSIKGFPSPFILVGGPCNGCHMLHMYGSLHDWHISYTHASSIIALGIV